MNKPDTNVAIRALGRIDHDGTPYELGDEFEVSASQAKRLIALDAAELAIAPDAEIAPEPGLGAESEAEIKSEIETETVAEVETSPDSGKQSK